MDKCPSIEKIIVMEEKDATGHPKVMSFNALMELGRKKYAEDPSLFEKLSKEVTADDLATLVYTSGTTGLPKGAMISHGNVFWIVQSLDAIQPHFATDQDCPGCLSSSFTCVSTDSRPFLRHVLRYHRLHTPRVSTRLLADFEEKRPTMILAVPRVCEKVYQKIITQVKEQSPFKQKVFHWGQEVGNQISRASRAAQAHPRSLEAEIQDRLCHHLQEAPG